MRLGIICPAIISKLLCNRLSLNLFQETSRSLSSMASESALDGRIEREFLRTVYKKVPRQVMSVVVTGGGSHLMNWLFTVPGSSNTVMSGSVPYSRSSLGHYLGNQDTSHSCDPDTAKALSLAAYKDAAKCLLADTRNLGELASSNVFGVSCTAALVSETIKKGSHRCHVATCSSSQTINTYSLELKKGLRERVGEDLVCSQLILAAIGESCSELSFPRIDLAQPCGGGGSGQSEEHEGEFLEVITKVTHSRPDSAIQRVYAGTTAAALFVSRPSTGLTEATATDDEVPGFAVSEDLELPPGTVVFPGSFNPLHQGHVALVLATLHRLGWTPSSPTLHPPVVFEISAVNADKPPIPLPDLIRRVAQFDPTLNPILRDAGLSNIGVCVTSKPLFVEKVASFQKCVLIIGADTFSRILSAKYYSRSNSEECSEASKRSSELCMIESLASIANRGCSFIVGGRLENPSADLPPTATRRFLTLPDMLGIKESELGCTLPPEVVDMFVGLDETDFRFDLSSSALRRKSV